MYNLVFYRPRLPFSYHATNLAAVAACIALMRFTSVRTWLGQLLTLLPQGYYVNKYAGGHFEPLSVVDWVVHVMMIVPNLEIIYAWRELACRTKDERAKTVFNNIAVLYAISHAQALVTYMSHCLVGYDQEVEVALLNLDYFLIRLHLFGFCAVLWFGWWTILPVSVLILKDVLLLHNPVGIMTSCLSLAAALSEKSLPVPFKIGFALFAFLPPLFPSSSTDVGHTIGAALVNVPLFLISHSLNEILRKERQKEA